MGRIPVACRGVGSKKDSLIGIGHELSIGKFDMLDNVLDLIVLCFCTIKILKKIDINQSTCSR